MHRPHSMWPSRSRMSPRRPQWRRPATSTSPRQCPASQEHRGDLGRCRFDGFDLTSTRTYGRAVGTVPRIRGLPVVGARVQGHRARRRDASGGDGHRATGRRRAPRASVVGVDVVGNGARCRRSVGTAQDGGVDDRRSTGNRERCPGHGGHRRHRSPRALIAPVAPATPTAPVPARLATRSLGPGIGLDLGLVVMATIAASVATSATRTTLVPTSTALVALVRTETPPLVTGLLARERQ